MDRLLELFKALSDETRLRIMVLLLKRDYCVCELTEILELSQPKISKHLSKLRDLGFVSTFRDKQFMVYKITINNQVFKVVLETVLGNIEDYPVLMEDAKRTANCIVRERRQ